MIPAYNYAHYLPSAIDSILRQTYQNLELIVVDDGSSDNTREVVGAYQDPRVRYVWQANAGLSASRNTGIREASFPLVAFLDADDVWLPSFLEEAVTAFDRLGPSFAAVAANTARIDLNGERLPAPKFDFDSGGERGVKDFVLRNRPLSSSIVIRRDVFAECGYFDTSLRSSEDRDMWIRICTKRRFWLLAPPLALIRRHGSNMSKNAVRMKCNTRSVLLKAFRSRTIPIWHIGFWLRVFSTYFFQIAWTHYDEGKRAHGFFYLGISTLLWPFFVHPASLFEPPLFRLRALAQFSLRLLGRRKRLA